MNDFNIKLMLYTFLAIIIALCFTYQHEKIHEAIDNNYGCTKTSITWFFWGAEERCISHDVKSNDTHKLLHSLNELIGYNLLVFVIWWYSDRVMKIDENAMVPIR